MNSSLRNTARRYLRILPPIALVLLPVLRATAAPTHDIEVRGTGTRPQLFFACCNGEMTGAEELFADGSVIASLQRLNAGVAIGTDDFSAARAKIVAQLNGAGIPVIASLVVPGEQGYYLNSGNAPQAAARFTEFQEWTARYQLHWSAVGLDIEPDIRLFNDLLHHRLQLAPSFLVRYFQFAKMRSARQAYADLIRRMQSQGYEVQTYQLPLIVAEREAHVTLLERLLGIVDVRGNEEVVMIYTSFNKALGSSIIWTLGPDAQAIAIGTTVGGDRALNWNEFSQALIVAAHFSNTIGVFNLEGAVQRDYLVRLEKMDWNQSVTISAPSLAKAHRLRMGVVLVLWLGELAPYLLLALIFGLAWAAIQMRLRQRARRGARTA
jgi:hypothetical protein